MKLQLFNNLAARLRAHKIIGGVIIGLLGALAVAGSIYGWQLYQYRQTSEYAFTKIKEALSPPEPARLAKLVDFNSLTDDLANAVARNFPFFQAGADQQRNIKHIIQTALLKKFLAKEENSKKTEEESEEARLARELQILPPDFIGQLVSSLNINPTDKDNALLNAKIENPLLSEPFTLVFNMRRTQDGFRVQHMVNANETARRLRVAILARNKAQREACERKNAATTKQMNSILPILSCTADAGYLSDGRTVVMVVHVLARNKSDVKVNNMSLDASICKPDGKVIVQRYLNAAQAAPQGSDFSHRWNFELDGASDLARSLIGAQHLICHAKWQTLGLNNGKVLHIKEVPNPDIPCDIAGHNHPAGFCTMPLFVN